MLYLTDNVDETEKDRGLKKHITDTLKDFPSETKNRWKENGYLHVKDHKSKERR